MKNNGFGFLRLGGRLLLMTALWCIAFTLPPASAQTAWIVGNEWARMDPPSGGITFNALPAHPNVPDTYQGDLVTRSSYIQLDPEGFPLFFIVDGNVYDGEGYLIAPALDDAQQTVGDCAYRTDGLIYPSRGELAVAPVPGKCGVWYVFHQRLLPNVEYPYHQLQMSVIDMTVDNPYFNGSGRKGRVCDLEAMLDLGINSTSNCTDPFNISGGGPGQIPDNGLFEPGADNGVVHFDVVHNFEENRDLLLAFTGYTLTVYDLLNNGVYKRLSIVLQESWNHRSRAKGEIAVANHGSTVRIALPVTRGSFINPTEYHESWMIHLTLDLATQVPEIIGDLEEFFIDRVPISPWQLNELGDDIYFPGTGGIEFSPNGRYSYWLNSYRTDNGPNGSTQYLGYFDWDNGTIHFIDVEGVLPFVDSQMELASAPDGSGLALYVCGTSATAGFWLGALLGPDNPTSAIWLPDAIELQGVSLLEDGSIGQLFPDLDRYHLLPKQDLNDQSQAMLAGESCCGAAHAMLSFRDHLVPAGVASWTTTSNPFQDRTIIRVTGELRFQAGAEISAHDLEFRMDAGTSIVIEEGALFACYGCTFTNACPDALWKGFRVEGDRYDFTQDDGHQGQLRLFDSSVDHAEVGVWCGREVAPGVAHPSYGGGAVRAYNCLFTDCVVGARVEGYHRYDGNGAELPNLNYFGDCRFETTVAWITDEVPDAHLYLRDVNGVDIDGCTFVNSAPELFSIEYLGRGIFAHDAGFRCMGYGLYDQHRFHDLTAGIVASVPDPASHYVVDGMGFKGNGQGVVDLGSTDARITNNEFILRGADATSDVASVGVQLFQSERYTVERNTFTDQGTNVVSVGIWFVGPSYEDNQIYDNEFNDLSIGSFVEGQHRALGDVPQIMPGLQLLCGDYSGNNADQFVLQEGYIKYDQGLPTSGMTTANNRYQSAVDCSDSGTGPSYHVGFWAWSDYGLNVRYNYYENASNPEMRPDCIEDLNGDPISFIGDWFYDLLDVSAPQAFDKEVNCPNGVLDQIEGPGIGGVAELTDEVRQRQAELLNAIGQYTETIDRKETGNVVAMIDHQPWHPSYLVRDTLFAHYPLSDSVMRVAIKRVQPLDTWHLTQVLLQNSPLSVQVWDDLAQYEPLPPYFLDLLKYYDSGGGLKSAMEAEIVLRQQQKTRAQHLLFQAWSADSTQAGRRDSILTVLMADSLGDGLRGCYLNLLYGGQYGDAQVLESELDQRLQSKYLSVWGKIFQDVDGDWSQTSPTDISYLYNMAYAHESSTGALSWAALLHLHELDSIPYPVVPASVKSLWMRKSHRQREDHSGSELGVLPNPASDRVAFTYPEGLEQGVIEVYNAQGQLVRTIALNGRKGLMESHVGGLMNGLYDASLILDGHRFLNAKFSVSR